MSKKGVSLGLVKALVSQATGADPAVIEQAVSDWLDDHPEATTTVADGSITEQKLASAIAAKINQISGMSDEIDDIKNAFEKSGEIIVPGFNDFTPNASGTTYVTYTFPTVYASDTTIDKISFYARNRGSADASIKLLTCHTDTSNRVLVDKISDAIAYTFSVASGEYEAFNIPLATPFVIESGEQFAIALSGQNSVLDPTGTGSQCAGNAQVTPYADIAIGSRLITAPTYTQYLCFTAYVAGKYMPEYDTSDEVTSKITVVINEKTSNISADTGNKIVHNWLLNSTAISKYETELMAHCATIYDGGDGFFYVPYYGDETVAAESIGNNVVCRLSKVSQYDLRNSEIVDVLRKNETVGDFVQSAVYSPYDPNILIVNDTIRYFMVAKNGNNDIQIAYRDIDKDTLALDDTINTPQIVYTIAGTQYTDPMTATGLGKMIDRYYGQESGGTIGVYPIMTSMFVEQNNTVYGFISGLDAGSNATNKNFSGCIIKSTDNGQTWTVVGWANDIYTPFDSSQPMWEASIAFIDSNTLAVAFKGNGAPVALYHIDTNTWSNKTDLLGYYAQDDTIDSSKPCIFYSNGYLYYLNNVLPRLVTSDGTIYRSRVKMFKLSTAFEKIGSAYIVSDSGCQYITVCNQKGRYYMCYTEDKSHRNSQMKGNISVMPFEFEVLF